MYEFFHQNGLNDKKRPFLERLKRTLYAYRNRRALVMDYLSRHKWNAKSIFESIYRIKVNIPESAMKADVIQASLIVSIDKKYRDYLSKNFWSLRFPTNAWGFNSHHLNHGLILFYETGDKKWREETIAHEIQHSNDALTWERKYSRDTWWHQ